MTVAVTADLLASFRDRFPEFSTVSDARVEDNLEEATFIFCLCERAVLYLAAHLITLDNDSGLGSTGGQVDGGEGEVASESVGKVSGSWKTMADKGKDTFFTTTPYGRKYIMFRNACAGYAFPVRVH